MRIFGIRHGEDVSDELTSDAIYKSRKLGEKINGKFPNLYEMNVILLTSDAKRAVDTTLNIKIGLKKDVEIISRKTLNIDRTGLYESADSIIDIYDYVKNISNRTELLIIVSHQLLIDSIVREIGYSRFGLGEKLPNLGYYDFEYESY